MAVSCFDLFKIGIGPSSSHTIGPMRAAATFVTRLESTGLLAKTHSTKVELFGSLGHTGRGHGTDKAVMLGLEGEQPDLIDPDCIGDRLKTIFKQRSLKLAGHHLLAFHEKEHMKFHKRKTLPYHSNGMRFLAFDAAGEMIESRDYYSVGGGFVVSQDEAAADRIVADSTSLPYPFKSGDELLALCAEHDLSIAQIMFENEKAWREPDQIKQQLKLKPTPINMTPVFGADIGRATDGCAKAIRVI